MLAKAASGQAAQRAGMQCNVPRPLPSVCRRAVCRPADRLRVSRPQVSASSATPTAATSTEELLLLDQNTFYPYLEAAGDTVVVVDFLTDWCGPCKVIYPELVKLAQERPDIRIVKFNCNKANKELGVKLAIKVAPTFHVYKNSVKISEMTGAKLEQLVALIDQACGLESIA